MKKLGSMFFFALCLTLALSTSALASYTYNGVTYADGGDITSSGFFDTSSTYEPSDSITTPTAYTAGDGYLYYIPAIETETASIILDNATINTTSSCGICAPLYAVSLTLVGENSIVATNECIWVTSLSIDGDGSLDLYCDSSGSGVAIYAGYLTIYGGDIVANTGYNYPIYIKFEANLYGGSLTTDGALLVNNGSLTIDQAHTLRAKGIRIDNTTDNFVICTGGATLETCLTDTLLLTCNYVDYTANMAFFGDVTLDGTSAIYSGLQWFYEEYITPGMITIYDDCTITIAEDTVMDTRIFGLDCWDPCTIINNGTLYLWDEFFSLGMDAYITIEGDGIVYLGDALYEGTTAAETASAHSFTDVVADSYYEDAVIWAVNNGVTSGTTATTFEPSATCTRGQVVTFLWRAMGEPTPAITENPFSDVSETSPFYTAILWAVGEGITTGYDDGTFRPTNTCTTGQVLTFLYRTVGEPDTSYESAYAVGAASAFVNAINWADESNLLSGLTVNISGSSPRSDIVTYLYRNAGSPAV